MPSIDLTYRSMTRRSLDARTLLVVIIMLSIAGLMNSALKVDFMPLSKPLMKLTCNPALFIIEITCLPRRGTIACFLEGPLVVMGVFFLPLGCVTFKEAL